MPLFHNGDDLVLFVHVPKCGGTAIEKAFMKAGWDVGYMNEPKATGYNEAPCNAQHYHAELIEHLIMPSKNCTDQFTVIRNPYDRLISEFVWQAGLKDYINGTGFDSRFFVGLEKFAIQRLTAYKVNEMQYQLDPEGFINKGRSFIFDNHLRPQHHFVTNDWNLYWYEEMDQKFWPEISNKYGLEPSGHFNIGVDKKIARPQYHMGINKKFKDLFVELYYEDCKLFGYDLPF
jgi:hypothetical protein|tara:strand:+ start:56 stop:751 length:696 start_codon:yes stop_codon:yes gene_type:complete